MIISRPSLGITKATSVIRTPVDYHEFFPIITAPWVVRAPIHYQQFSQSLDVGSYVSSKGSFPIPLPPFPILN